jgi:6-phosphogluconolactonase
MTKHVQIYSTKEALADAAAARVSASFRTAMQQRGYFNIALAGGSTPLLLYERLAQTPRTMEIDWSRVNVFWSDERAVPLDHADSNYRMAREALQQLPLPKENVHPMFGHNADLDAAARLYERVIRSLVPGTPPRFDVVLLGMGPDGHTASLFPHSPALRADDALVVATPRAPLKPQVPRLTFTTTLINAAAEVLVLVAGADKAATVQRVLEGPAEPDALPAQQIAPRNGTLYWMVDQAAAGKLTG